MNNPTSAAKNNETIKVAVLLAIFCLLCCSLIYQAKTLSAPIAGNNIIPGK
jgi:hypothetical protein